MDAYSLLECERTVRPDDLKESYHRILLCVHPDKNNSSPNTDAYTNNLEKFIRVQAAYRMLNNRETRATYDNHLRQTELQESASNLNAKNDEALFLNLYRHFEYDLSNELYFRNCDRCGGLHSAPKTELNRIFNEINACLTNDNIVTDLFSNRTSDTVVESVKSESFILTLECDSCSIVINVLII